jgi:hypothetical protein
MNIELHFDIEATYTPGHKPRGDDPGDGPVVEFDIDGNAPAELDDAVEACLNTSAGQAWLIEKCEAALPPDSGPDPDDARDRKMDMDEEDRMAKA